LGLHRRSSVIRQNFRDRRCKIIHTSARYDDGIAATVSFLGDAQESPAFILAELHVKTLSLNPQFFRLDNVIYHFWSRRLYCSRFTEWKKNPRLFVRCASRAQPSVEAIEVSQSRLPAISSLPGDRTRTSASDGRWALFWERAWVILPAAPLIGDDNVAFEQSETKALALRQLPSRVIAFGL
jgi:hypothetical protein